MARTPTITVEAPALNSVGVSDQLRSFIERVEHVEAQQADLAEDKRQIYQELKGAGFDAKVIRKLVADRKKDKDALAEFEAITDLYRNALGWTVAVRDYADEGPATPASVDPLI